MSRGKLPHGTTLVPKHERCECGHCRCKHRNTYQECLEPGCDCGRYAWPGRGADLPADHDAQPPKSQSARKKRGGS